MLQPTIGHRTPANILPYPLHAPCKPGDINALYFNRRLRMAEGLDALFNAIPTASRRAAIELEHPNAQ
jgi:hypothetical protein